MLIAKLSQQERQAFNRQVGGRNTVRIAPKTEDCSGWMPLHELDKQDVPISLHAPWEAQMNATNIPCYLRYAKLDTVTFGHDFPGTPGQPYGLVLQGQIQVRTLCGNPEFCSFLRQHNLFPPDVNALTITWHWEDLSTLSSRLEVPPSPHQEALALAVEQYVTAISARINRTQRPPIAVGGKHENPDRQRI